MDTLETSTPKKIGKCMSRIAFALCFAVVIAIVGGATTAYFCKLSRPYLSHPVSSSDRVELFLSDGDYMAGDPLFGYPAPLENYIPIFTLKRNDDVPIYDWIDESVTAQYYLSLYDEDGVRQKALFLMRISENAFEASISDVFFEKYLEAKGFLEEECAIKGVNINDFRLIQVPTEGAEVIIANTSGGFFGVLYRRPATGLYINMPPEGFYDYLDRLLNEEELRDLFLLVSR